MRKLALASVFALATATAAPQRQGLHAARPRGEDRRGGGVMLEGPEVGCLPTEPVVEAGQVKARVDAGGVGEQAEVACGGVSHLRIADDRVGFAAGGVDGHAAWRHEVVVEVAARHVAVADVRSPRHVAPSMASFHQCASEPTRSL